MYNIEMFTVECTSAGIHIILLGIILCPGN